MNPTHRQKTISYVILGIVVVIALAVYIYLLLSNPSQLENNSPVATFPQQVTLSPEQSAQKAALIASLSGESPQVLTKQQVNEKAALLKSLQSN